MDYSQLQRIAIFGSADVTQDDPAAKDAFAVAEYLAKRGKIIVNGGGPGVMKAATDGAHAGGGKAITVSFKPENAPNFEGHDRTNFADQDFMATNYFERVRQLMDESDAFVIFRGGTGTISEWGMVWLMAHIYYGIHKPFVLYGAYWHEILEVLKKHLFLGDLEDRPYRVVTSIEEMDTAFTELASQTRYQRMS